MIPRGDKNEIDHKTLQHSALHVIVYLLYEYSKRFVQPVVQPLAECKGTMRELVQLSAAEQWTALQVFVPMSHVDQYYALSTDCQFSSRQSPAPAVNTLRRSHLTMSTLVDSFVDTKRIANLSHARSINCINNSFLVFILTFFYAKLTLKKTYS